MAKEVFVVESLEDFLKLADKVDLVLRIDPYLIAYYYGLVFCLDLSTLPDKDVREALQSLKTKTIFVKSIKTTKELLRGLSQ
ncbi:MAG TPA: hypothetical protein ENF55_04435 [Thermoprotei archaeon]|nr:MAG: hypothetical protein DRJ63_07545 [Thermoprotei archaeon]HDI75185.1 hypothetical protein [Thermoprotei archaeon]